MSKPLSQRRGPGALVAMACALALCAEGPAWAAEAPLRVEIPRHKPCNLFSVEEPVQFEAKLRAPTAGAGRATARVMDYFGQEVWSRSYPLACPAKQALALPLEVGRLDPGYYELRLEGEIKADPGGTCAGSQTISFGVAPFVTRTAEEVRKGGYRFGLKMFYLDKAWWRGNAEWDEREAVGACARLGLQWTRALFSQEAHLSTADLIRDFPMNVVLKIEGFPAECYDAKRYGPMEEWEKKRGKGQWMRNTVPRQEPYLKWLRDEVAKVPPEQNVFEIWNEPWGKMSPEEFAELCRMIVPVVKEVRPNAIVGPNTALGPIDWEKRFIRAGGMKDMDMVTVHPYSFTPMPETRTRVSIRNYHDFLRSRLGRDLDLYVTEYGWSSAPKNKRYGVTEAQQAERTVRQSLMLYAEGIKTLIPHCMADREQDPAEREHWFGFFRLNHQPKPVLMAHAACARMIDGSRFVGDLWYGPGVGAMLFQRGGLYTLALWTEEDKENNLRLDVGARQVTVVGLMGRERKTETDDGALALTLSGNVVYVVGVGPALAQQAAGPDKDLNPDCWSRRNGSFSMKRASTPPRIDGDLGDWAGASPIALKDIGNNNTSPEDCSAQAFLAWDSEHVYVAVKVRDDMIAAPPSGKGSGDAFELRIGTRPSRQLDLNGWGLYDYVLSISPTSAGGRPSLRMENCNWDSPLVNPSEDDPSGIRWAAKNVGDGWTAEAAIPVKLLDGLTAKTGERISCMLQVTDFDRSGKAPVRLAYGESDRPREWAYLTLSQ